MRIQVFLDGVDAVLSDNVGPLLVQVNFNSHSLLLLSMLGCHSIGSQLFIAVALSILGSASFARTFNFSGALFVVASPGEDLICTM